LPTVQGLFTLVRRLASREPVTEIATSKWLVQKHGLASLTWAAGDPRFRDDFVAAALTWSKRTSALRPLVDDIRRRGGRVALIKGAAYAGSLYQRPAERPMGDLDVLVTGDSEHAAVAALQTYGFELQTRPAFHHATAWARGDVVIDLHRSIIAAGRGSVDLDAVWKRSVPGWLDGTYELEPSDALAFHLIHLARNRLRAPMIHVIDTARLLERVPGHDPAEALARARSWRLGKAAEIALRFCEAILNAQSGLPVGHIGPTLDEIATFERVSIARKLLFDVATAGSPQQFAAHALAQGIDWIRARS
jgi:hypothetical protein